MVSEHRARNEGGYKEPLGNWAEHKQASEPFGLSEEGSRNLSKEQAGTKNQHSLASLTPGIQGRTLESEGGLGRHQFSGDTRRGNEIKTVVQTSSSKSPRMQDPHSRLENFEAGLKNRR